MKRQAKKWTPQNERVCNMAMRWYRHGIERDCLDKEWCRAAKEFKRACTALAKVKA